MKINVFQILVELNKDASGVSALFLFYFSNGPLLLSVFLV